MAEKNDLITNRKELLDNDEAKTENSSNKGQTQERYESGPAENQSQEQSKNDIQNPILENRNHEPDEREDETNANENCSDFSEVCEERHEINSVDCLPVGKHDKAKEKYHDNGLSMSIDINKMKNHKKFICIDVNSYHKTKLVAISKFEIDLDFLKQILRSLYKSDAIKNFTFENSLMHLKTFSFKSFQCIHVYNVSELSESESESENENESYSGLQGNNQGENQQSGEPENGAVNRNFDELDSTSNSNEVRQQTAATGQAASNVHPSGTENNLHNSPDIIRNLRFNTSSASYRNPQENEVIVLRHVPVSLQRFVQENVFIDLRQVSVFITENCARKCSYRLEASFSVITENCSSPGGNNKRYFFTY
ncbi:Hypothetical predicted protein [Mytilus galloprovincialis]|uniref:Uncharacterized protein n=1 Tax=Mytilus galloprovincialis TaxID=29158 RepID=A0A8B6HBB9_MYTGA|nr:Hypothetical predicted protein [Mytilus galloprovincialis]